MLAVVAVTVIAVQQLLLCYSNYHSCSISFSCSTLVPGILVSRQYLVPARCYSQLQSYCRVLAVFYSSCYSAVLVMVAVLTAVPVCQHIISSIKSYSCSILFL